MNSQAPTLFDDFFLQDDEPSQQNKSTKKSSRKKKSDASLSLFDVEDDSDASAVSDAQNENNTETTTEKASDEIASMKPIESIETFIETASDKELKNFTEEKKESSIHLVSEEIPEPHPDETIENDKSATEKAEMHSSKNDDLKVLESQYFEAIGNHGIGKDFFLPDEEVKKESLEENNSENHITATKIEDDTEYIDSFQPENWNLTKHYYSIGEVANMFEVNISHIRFWTNEFKLKPRTNKKGNRYYTPAQIETLQLIHYLVKVKKHTIKGAQEKLKAQKKLVQNNMLLKDSLMDLKSKLEELKNHF